MLNTKYVDKKNKKSSVFYKSLEKYSFLYMFNCKTSIKISFKIKANRLELL